MTKDTSPNPGRRLALALSLTAAVALFACGAAGADRRPPRLKPHHAPSASAHHHARRTSKHRARRKRHRAPLHGSSHAPAVSQAAAPTKAPGPLGGGSNAPAPANAPVTLAAGNASYWRGFNENVVEGGAMTASTLATWDSRFGATVDRYTLDWATVYPDSPTATPNWWSYDQIYQALIGKGIRPVIVVMSAPGWAISSGGSNGCPNACAPTSDHDADFVNFVGQVAQRYPQAAAIEIWNEENAAVNWASYVDPAHYASLLAAAYAQVKTVAPGMLVLMGSLAGRSYDEYSAGGQVIGMIDSEFLAGVYSYWRAHNGRRVYMDGIGVHAYPSRISDDSAFQTLDRVRDVRDGYGDAARPLYITETGLSPVLSGVTADQAARMDGQLIQALPASDVKAVLVHTLVDVWTGVNEGYGLLSAASGGSFAPAPGFCLLAQLNGSSYACPLPVDDPVQDARWRAQQLLHDAYEVARSYSEAHGTFVGLTNQTLNAADPSLSATPPASLTPGPSADPAGVWISGANATSVMLCNASQAGLVYCIYPSGSGASGATSHTATPVTYSEGSSVADAAGAAAASAGQPGAWLY
jgi:hypothetical protein